MVEPPTRECIAALKESFGPALFFFVGQAELVQQMIAAHVKVVDASSDQGWHSLFDAADEKIHNENELEEAPREAS